VPFVWAAVQVVVRVDRLGGGLQRRVCLIASAVAARKLVLGQAGRERRAEFALTAQQVQFHGAIL
jgi:hypothetical protein